MGGGGGCVGCVGQIDTLGLFLGQEHGRTGTQDLLFAMDFQHDIGENILKALIEDLSGLPETLARYSDTTPAAHEHRTLVCIKCGEVQQFDTDILEAFILLGHDYST